MTKAKSLWFNGKKTWRSEIGNRIWWCRQGQESLIPIHTWPRVFDLMERRLGGRKLEIEFGGVDKAKSLWFPFTPGQESLISISIHQLSFLKVFHTFFFRALFPFTWTKSNSTFDDFFSFFLFLFFVFFFFQI